MNPVSRLFGLFTAALTALLLVACGDSNEPVVEVKRQPTPYQIPLAQAATSATGGWAPTCAGSVSGVPNSCHESASSRRLFSATKTRNGLRKRTL